MNKNIKKTIKKYYQIQMKLYQNNKKIKKQKI